MNLLFVDGVEAEGNCLGSFLPCKPSRALGLIGFPCEAASRENPEQLPIGCLRNVFFKKICMKMEGIHCPGEEVLFCGG